MKYFPFEQLDYKSFRVIRSVDWVDAVTWEFAYDLFCASIKKPWRYYSSTVISIKLHCHIETGFGCLANVCVCRFGTINLKYYWWSTPTLTTYHALFMISVHSQHWRSEDWIHFPVHVILWYIPCGVIVRVLLSRPPQFGITPRTVMLYS